MHPLYRTTREAAYVRQILQTNYFIHKCSASTSVPPGASDKELFEVFLQSNPRCSIKCCQIVLTVKCAKTITALCVHKAL